MKYWLLTTEYPPFFGGGIAAYTELTARMLYNHGHYVRVFIYDKEAHGIQETISQGVLVTRFSQLTADSRHIMGFVANLSYSYADIIAQYINKEGPPDIIESQEYLGLPYFLLQRKWTLDPVMAQLRVIVTAHNPKFLLDPIDRAATYQLPDYWIGEMERFSLRAADAVISPSAFLKEALKTALPGLEVAVIANPYELPEEPSTTIPREPRLLYVGRLQYFKGVLDLLEQVAPLWDRGFKWPLDLVGKDTSFYLKNKTFAEEIHSRYASYIKQGLISIHPQIPPNELDRIYRRAGLVVIPSRFDNLPYVLLEAMSRECVVVATGTGGQQEVIVDKQSGFVCQPGELGESIEKASRQSIEASRSMGKKARERAAQWTQPDAIYRQKMALVQSHQEDPSPTIFPLIRPRSRPPVATSKSGLLSIVVPYYNLGSYIFDTLDSLMKVPLHIRKEIIVVDDGSTEGVSIAALRKAARTYPETTIYRTANQGLAQARNFGASKASGTFLAFLDADDTIDPPYYARAIQILQYYDNLSFIGCWAQYFGADRHIWPTWNPEPPYALFHNPLNTSALVYLRDHFLSYGQNDPEMEYGMEDYESMIRMMDHGCYGASIPEPYFHYRVRHASMSRAFNPANQQYLYRLIVQKNPSIYAEYAQDLLFLLNANGPQFLIDSPSVPPPAHRGR